MQWMAIATLIVLLQWAGAIHWHLQQPFFALPPIESLAESQITFIAADSTRPVVTIELPQTLTRRDPDFFTLYSQLNDYLWQQRRLHQLLTGAETLLISYSFEAERQQFPKLRKKIGDLPWDFWLYQLLGAASLLMGCAFRAFHRGNPSTLCIFVAAVGYAALEWSMAWYATRELALDATIFRWLVALNHTGGTVFAAALIGLIGVYPRRILAPPHYLLYSLTIVGVLGNEFLQWLNWPLHLFYSPALPLFAFFCLLIFWQWRACAQSATHRQALLWLVFSVMGSLGLAFVSYIVPVAFGYAPWTSLAMTNMMAICVFLGFIGGVYSQNLFGIQHWWLRTWLISSLLVILIVGDICLAGLLNLSNSTQWYLISFILLWCYIPLRQRMGKCFALCSQKAPAEHPLLVSLLDKYHPLEFQKIQLPVTASTPFGITLQIRLDGNHCWQFIGKHFGFALFSEADKEYVVNLIRQDQTAKIQFSQTHIQRERERIMRDLHDDISADLLTLAFTQDSSIGPSVAKEALIKLRAIVYSLQSGELQSLQNHCLFWQEDFVRRCRQGAISGHWHQTGALPECALLPAAALNIYRILREGISNSIKHATAKIIEVKIRCTEARIYFSIMDNGRHKPLADWRVGNGLLSIKVRVEELKGEVRWDLVQRNGTEWAELDWSIPLQCLMESRLIEVHRHES